MKSVKLTGGRGKQRTVSTSEARANFASALKTVGQQKTIIGFDRYKETVAVLAPIEAVYVLAGRAKEVDKDVMDRVVRMAEMFLHRYPAPAASAERAPAKSAAKKGRKKAARSTRMKSKGGR
jgi:hypothetical protein